jgi:hypothetical protein
MNINNVARRLQAEWGTKEMHQFLRQLPQSLLHPLNYAYTEGAIWQR